MVIGTWDDEASAVGRQQWNISMTVGDGPAFEHDLTIFQTDQWHSLEKKCRADDKGIAVFLLPAGACHVQQSPEAGAARSSPRTL
jgi:hypothetical protein